MNIAEIIIVAVYVVSMTGVVLFSFGQLHLAWLYRRYRRGRQKPDTVSSVACDALPFVTVQLPIYNEKHVTERLLDAVAMLDWPRERIEIQVLDDSDDGTSDIIAGKIAHVQYSAPAIRHIRRTVRTGYKAGALQNGLQYARGAYIAIFDADFIPPADFLRRAMDAFTDPHIGMVQVRWGHLNKDFSLLTRLQALGLDGHFTVEQAGRLSVGSFINFNGTAGIWRTRCIVDAGGWSADTIAEDLDLSYRAQLRGWKFEYLEDFQAPAELPVSISAVKTQQFRWTKGGTEAAIKNLTRVLRSDLSLQKKMHGFFHLTASINYLLIFLASVVSIPLLFVKTANPQYSPLFHAMIVFAAGFVAISWFYWTVEQYRSDGPAHIFFWEYPLFIMLYMGLAFHNSVGVVEAFAGKQSPFVRTPKYNIVGASDPGGHRYRTHSKSGLITVVEVLLFLYFLFGVLAALMLQDYGLVPFHAMLAAGYAMVVCFSCIEAWRYGLRRASH
jgi:cellulose synthase/poly-beta-1,6-N-acetylglucosamine synthase-like glycosyltransferase